MRRVYTLFCCMFVFNANAATLLSVGARLCEYGKYYIKGACRYPTDTAALSRCPSGLHIITADSDTFVFKDVSTSVCDVRYDYYAYDKSIYSAFGGTGSLLSVGTRLCEYGKYYVKGACRYPTDATALSECDTGSHLIWVDNDTFTFKKLATGECYMTHSPYQHNKDIFMAFGGHGLLQTLGIPMRTLSNMRSRECTGAPDGYYRFLSADNESLIYADGDDCPTDTSGFIVMNNCQNIDTKSTDSESKISILYPDNNMCAVLCDAGSGIDVNGECTPFCYTDKIQRKIHVLYEGLTKRIPLWSKKVTTPALNVLLSDNTECYMSLIPGHSSESTLKVQYQNTRYHSEN